MIIAERVRNRLEDYEFKAQNLGIRLMVDFYAGHCPKHALTAEWLLRKLSGLTPH
jgi:hypothetical protein